MDKKQIQEIYKKQRHAYAQRRYYYKKKYGIELEPIPIVKNPTEKTIENYAKKVYKETKKVTKKKKAPQRKRNVPTAEEILLNRIRSLVNEGLGSQDKFEQYKADRVNQMLIESLPDEKKKRIDTLRNWEKSLPDIDAEVQRFIYDSSQSDVEMKNHSTAIWNRLSSVMLGVKPVFTEEYTEDDDI